MLDPLTLGNIKSAADVLTQLTAPLVVSRTQTSLPFVSPRPQTPILVPPLKLRYQPSLRPLLEDLGVDDDVVLELTKAFNEPATAFWQICVTKFEENCRQLIAIRRSSSSPPLPDLIEKLRRTYQVMYERCIRGWIDEHIPVLSSRISSINRATNNLGRDSVKPKKSKFNHDCIPLLEKYFDLNPFPSHADKSVLARKSGMAYRQIDVWFQNRRSRAKKEGKILKKLPSHEEPKISLELLEEQMGDWIIPEHERVDPVDSDVSEYEWQYDSDDEDTSAWTPRYPRNPKLPDLLNVASPPHAFPSVYPPSCDYDPFPVKEGKYKFPPPVWMRHPAKSIERRPMMDFDQFIADFARMNVLDGPRKRLVKKDPRKPTNPKRTQTPPPRPDRSAATLFITTRPLPAPLPSLIRSAVPIHITPPSPVSTLPLVSLPCRTTFPTPSPRSQHVTLSPPSPPAGSSGKPFQRRKMAPLPKRMPANTSTAHRGGTPATPETCVLSPSPSPSRSSSSRKSSFGSDCSSQTRISSDSSPASSVVVTPVSSPTALPEHLSSRMKYNLESVNELLDGRLSPVEGLHLELPSSVGFGAGVDKPSFEFTFGTSPPRSFVHGQS